MLRFFFAFEVFGFKLKEKGKGWKIKHIFLYFDATCSTYVQSKIGKTPPEKINMTNKNPQRKKQQNHRLS